MKLFYSPFHTFIHKVLVTIHEAGLWDEVTFVPTYPFKNRAGEDQGDAYSIAALNPLNKVPTLALDSGQVVYGSQAVVECVDSMSQSGNHLYPPAGPARWDAITRLALADTMFETTVMLVMEGWNPEENQRIEFFEWIWPKIIRGCDSLEAACKQGFDGFDHLRLAKRRHGKRQGAPRGTGRGKVRKGLGGFEQNQRRRTSLPAQTHHQACSNSPSGTEGWWRRW